MAALDRSHTQLIGTFLCVIGDSLDIHWCVHPDTKCDRIVMFSSELNPCGPCFRGDATMQLMALPCMLLAWNQQIDLHGNLKDRMRANLKFKFKTRKPDYRFARGKMQYFVSFILNVLALKLVPNVNQIPFPIKIGLHFTKLQMQQNHCMLLLMFFFALLPLLPL